MKTIRNLIAIILCTFGMGSYASEDNTVQKVLTVSTQSNIDPKTVHIKIDSSAQNNQVSCQLLDKDGKPCTFKDGLDNTVVGMLTSRNNPYHNATSISCASTLTTLTVSDLDTVGYCRWSIPCKPQTPTTSWLIRCMHLVREVIRDQENDGAFDRTPTQLLVTYQNPIQQQCARTTSITTVLSTALSQAQSNLTAQFGSMIGEYDNENVIFIPLKSRETHTISLQPLSATTTTESKQETKQS